MGGRRGKVASASGDFFDVKVAFILSFLAWPILYILNNGFQQLEQGNRALVMMLTGFGLLLAILFTLAKMTKSNDLLGYVLMLFAFTSMIDLIIAVEYHGYIYGFMSQYLSLGEPYLHSPWGSAISLFDGTGFYIIYLLLIHKISNGESWRSLGIYWTSALINSMIVLLLGIFSGKHTPTFCVYLNAPYAIVPIVALFRLFSRESCSAWNEHETSSGLVGKVGNLVVAIGLLLSIWITFVKGMLSLGSTFDIFLQFLKHEPFHLYNDPAPFSGIQALVFLFYIIPLQLVSLFYIFRKKKPQFLWDLGIVHAGTMLQAQFTFIVSALDPKLKSEYRSSLFDTTFWTNNLVILIVPHLFLGVLYLKHHAGGTKEKNMKKS